VEVSLARYFAAFPRYGRFCDDRPFVTSIGSLTIQAPVFLPMPGARRENVLRWTLEVFPVVNKTAAAFL